MKELVLLLCFLFISSNTHAEVKSFICVSQDSSKLVISFDDKTFKVKNNSEEEFDALIDKNRIIWDEKLPARTYLQTLNRLTGKLIVANENNGHVIDTYSCELRKK